MNIPMFIAALFTIAKIWRQLSVHKQMIKKMWFIYTMKSYSSVQFSHSVVSDSL